MPIMDRIEDTCSRFRAGEAEISRVFYSQPRPLEQHVFALRIQVAREVRNLREISQGELTEMVDRTDHGLPREDLVHELAEHYFEIRHYATLAYLLEGISGERVDWKALNVLRDTAEWTQYGRKERDCRAKWAKVSSLHESAGSFNSGGAGSVAFGVIGLEGGDYESLLAEVGKIILHDEMAHGDVLGNRHSLYGLVKTEENESQALEVIREYSTIRLHGRNYQYGNPVSKERIEAIARGEIEPIDREALKKAYTGAIDEVEWFERYHAAPKPLSATTIRR
ncbi:MAG: hypothetical protein GTO40_06290 [Deltaproteobacteria bacterium]|nr:hypothetical protein [Deltaproteobacteria bacterium]